MRRNLSRSLILSLVAVAGLIAACQDAFVSSGILYQEQNKWGKAEQMFKTAIWRNEQNADAHYQLAFTYAYRVENEHLERGEVDSARIKTAGAYEHYQRAAELKPDKYRFNPEADDESLRHPSDTGIRSLYATLFNEGVRLQNEDPEKAILYFELAGLADPRGAAGFDAELLVHKLEYNQNRDDQEAIRAILAEAQQLEVGDDWEDAAAKRADLVEFEATMHRALGQDAMAAQLYEGLLASDPENVELIRQVANLRMNQGDRLGAADLYERALEIAEASPLDYSVEERYGLAYLAADACFGAEAYERCIELSRKGLAFATNNTQRSELTRMIGWSNFELENYAEAASAVESVVLDGGFEPTSADGWNLYYQTLLRMNRVDEASQARDRFNALRGG